MSQDNRVFEIVQGIRAVSDFTRRKDWPFNLSFEVGYSRM